jgi:hypothetical protein
VHRDMNTLELSRFDRWTRTVSTVLSRRGLAGALALAATAIPGLAEAKNKKKKRKKIKRNALGCVNVGNLCKNAGQCCSGICTGKKGKKRCKAHDTGGCQAGDLCPSDLVACTTSTGDAGACRRTTGNAGYCAAGGDCFPCTKDADCQGVCGLQAACIVICVGCGPSNTACAAPSGDSCDFPM